MVQYYTLEQAAHTLRTTPEQLKEMAKRNEVRAFQDRGNLRFRASEIDELARSRGLGSDQALPLGDAAKGGSASAAAPRRKSKLPAQEPAGFEDDEAPIGREPASSFGKGGPVSSRTKGGPPSPPKGVSRPSKLGQPPSSKTPRRPTQTAGPKSPPPRPGSDSDVRLVADGSDLDFKIGAEAPGAGAPAGPRKTRGPKPAQSPDPGDSGVRIVPLEEASDSDVKITPDAGLGDSALAGPASGKKPSDSDIRLDDSSKHVGPAGRARDQNPVTEEIDLDAEQARADAAARTQAGARGRPKPNPLNLPTSSPFELSEADIGMDEPAAGPKTPRPGQAGAKSAETDSSSDFELTPVGEIDPTPLESSSSEQAALPLADDDEVGLGELTGAGAGQSGINLQDPADGGISLEQDGSDEIEFELSPDAGATPKPGAAAADEPGSSEFELTLGADDSSSVEEGAAGGEESSEFELALDSAEVPAEGEEESSSEFELSLDESGEAAAPAEGEVESDSEFELTLDADGGLEASGEADALAGDEEEKDIFETDFEVPALGDEESGSEAVALEDEDTDLETSDFDLALDEEGSAEEDAESGSQVVGLDDEEEADEGAETEARPRRSRAAAEDEEGELDLEIDPTAEPEEEEEEMAVGAGAPAAAPPASWGPLPALLMLPSVIVLFVVGLLSFELVGTMWNYRQPGRTTGFGVVLHPIAKYFDNSLPD